MNDRHYVEIMQRMIKTHRVPTQPSRRLSLTVCVSETVVDSVVRDASPMALPPPISDPFRHLSVT